MRKLKNVFILVCFILLTSFNLNDKSVKIYKVENKKEEIRKVFKIVESLPFKYKDLIKKQILLESSHLTSPIYVKNNNPIGMRLAKERITTAISSKNGYAVYKNVEDAILDRLLYEASYMKNFNKTKYLQYLNDNYADGSGEYIKTLGKIKLDKY